MAHMGGLTEESALSEHGVGPNPGLRPGLRSAPAFQSAVAARACNYLCQTTIAWTEPNRRAFLTDLPYEGLDRQLAPNSGIPRHGSAGQISRRPGTIATELRRSSGDEIEALKAFLHTLEDRDPNQISRRLSHLRS